MGILHVSADEVVSRRHRGRGRLVALALAAAFAVPMAIGATPSAANHAPANCTSNGQQGILCVHVKDTPDPVAYSTFDGNQTYLAYDATVESRSASSNLSHVSLTEDLPAGTTVVSVESSRGTCSAAAGDVTCSFGAFKPGDFATVRVVVTTPATIEENPLPSVITNAATAAFDERFSDQTGGRQDTVTYSEDTTVTGTAATTFIPEGHDGKVGTDPDASQYANATVNDAGTDLLAKLNVLDPDGFCKAGTIRIGLSVYICRSGGFVDASVIKVDDGTTYSSTRDPLVFHLRWNAELVSSLQTKKNFVIFYQAAEGAKTQVIKANCGGLLPKLPCKQNVTEHPDGSWSAELVKASNGRMR
jgi:hypothetical protein